PGEGADELHQLHAFMIVEVLQHGLLLVGRVLLRAMTNGEESANQGTTSIVEQSLAKLRDNRFNPGQNPT
ncbi:MAG: hypothetical protein NZ808_02415, partial [Myxococcota bacterium]|nr:hypothetical protein [Myxococcota bacterium]